MKLALILIWLLNGILWTMNAFAQHDILYLIPAIISFIVCLILAVKYEKEKY
jgi:uncharacterized membrane protein YcjF (UPF0283 family)